jgi:hypothetical protein
MRLDPLAELTAYDSLVTIPRRYELTTIVNLSSNNPKRFRTVLQLQIIRIVSGFSMDAATRPSSFTYYNKKNQQEKVGTYKRLHLCMVVGTHELVYLIENGGCNEHLWSKSPQHRDSGVVTIGTVFALLNPLPIKSEFANIPMVETEGGVVLLKRPDVYKTILIQNNIAQNVTRAYVLNFMMIRLHCCAPLNTRCSGLLCDKQRSYELRNSKKGCGCYSMLTRQSNIVVTASFDFEYNGQTITIDNFCSLQFMRLFLSADLPHSTQRNMLDANSKLDRIYDAMEDVFEYINNNGGFTIIGWYKLGDKVDASSNNDSNNREVTGKINYHVTNIFPTETDVNGCNNHERLKFDVNTLF